MAPPRFCDLHKDIDEFIENDFQIGSVNLEVKQNVNGGDFATGPNSFTYNLNKTPTGDKTASIESKMVLGSSVFGKSWFQGWSFNEKWTDSGVYTATTEIPNAFNKVKIIAGQTIDTSFKDTSFYEVVHQSSRATTTVNVDQANGSRAMPTSVNASLVFTPMHRHNIGANFNYNVKSGQLDHHFKLQSNHAHGYLVAGMKNANSAELLISQNVDKSSNLPLVPVSFNVKKAFVKANMDVDGKQDVMIGYEQNIDYFGAKIAQSVKYNPIAGDVYKTARFAITDGLDGVVSMHSNSLAVRAGGVKLGAKLCFSV